jgi:hypothetical protein
MTRRCWASCRCRRTPHRTRRCTLSLAAPPSTPPGRGGRAPAAPIVVPGAPMPPGAPAWAANRSAPIPTRLPCTRCAWPMTAVLSPPCGSTWPPSRRRTASPACAWCWKALCAAPAFGRAGRPQPPPRIYSEKCWRRGRRPTRRSAPRDRALLLLGFGAALRLAELIVLMVGDVGLCRGRDCR